MSRPNTSPGMECGAQRRFGWFVLGLIVLCLQLVAGETEAKSLHWPQFHVTAELDADGRLHVLERQEIVFDGDWNGGYRRFRLDANQELELHRILRIDAASGREIPLVEGDVDQVDHYEHSGDTLRWRSRLASDPPFAQQRITYVLDYTLSRILVAEDDGTYLLSHDFTFADRDGVMEKVRVDLAVDSQWQALAELPSTFTREQLEPGDSLIVDARLRHTGDTPPAAVWLPPSKSFQWSLMLSVLAAIGALSAVFFSREAQLGRFNRLTPIDEIDEPWLEANLFRFLPEEAGAVWDESIGAPEVAAIIARLVAEGKLASEVAEERFLFIRTRILKLRLLPAGKKGKRSYEATLVRKLFVKEGTETDTNKIREHYKRSGFNPASEIRTELETAMRRHEDLKHVRKSPLLRPIVIAFVLSGLVTLFGMPSQHDPIFAFVSVLASSIGAAVLATRLGGWWRSAFEYPIAYALLFLIPALVPTLILAAVSFTQVLEPLLRIDTFLLLGLAAFAVATVASALRGATSRDDAQRLATRQRVAAARRYLAYELSQPEPRLRDEWYPYVVAFGLGSAAEHWFRRFGGSARTGAERKSGSWSSGSSTSTSTSTGTAGGGWSGGGGAFGGAGAGGAWVAAVGGIAAGVSRPSSSSSSGGGGGSSSGGGGGGGW